MLLHYYLMPWTLLENSFATSCSQTVVIRICCDTHRDIVARCYMHFIWGKKTADSVFRHFTFKIANPPSNTECDISCGYSGTEFKYASEDTGCLSVFRVLTAIRCWRKRMWKRVIVFWCDIFVLSDWRGFSYRFFLMYLINKDETEHTGQVWYASAKTTFLRRIFNQSETMKMF